MKKLILILWGSFCLEHCIAQSVSRESAMQKARMFLSKRDAQIDETSGSSIRRVQQAPPLFYVFNAKDSQGFVIVSGDERTDEILGYADNGTFDETEVPENMQVWLQSYADEIETIRENGINVSVSKTIETHPAIAPLVKTTWNQEYPYNDCCPRINGKACLTGCVATAMAQLMYYHKWPEGNTAEILGYSLEKMSTLSLDPIPSVKFEWEKMLDFYGTSTQEEVHAVAQLMRYCGQSVKTEYGLSFSSAFSSDVVNAMLQYFNYDKSIRYVYRSEYSIRSWDELLYEELTSGRPIYYSGFGLDSGHAFICDGYDGNGFYHINWGWGGACDGYFKLSVADPNDGRGGYPRNQAAIIGIQRPTGTTVGNESLVLNGSPVVKDNYLYAFFYNNDLPQFFDYGFAYKSADDRDFRFLTNDGLVIKGKSCQYSVGLSNLKLKNGIYKFFPVSKKKSDNEYSFHGDGRINIEVEVKNQSYKITTHPQYALDIVSYDFRGNKIRGWSQQLKFRLYNTGDEFSGPIYLMASNGIEKEQCVDLAGVSFMNGSEEEICFNYSFTGSGTWNLWISLDEKGEKRYGPYEIVIREPSAFSWFSLRVINTEIEPYTDATFSCLIKNESSGDYVLPLICYFWEKDGNNTKYLGKSIVNDSNISSGDTVKVSFQYKGLEIGKNYFACATYYPNESAYSNEQYLTYNTYFTVIENSAPSKVQSINHQGNRIKEVYDLKGNRINNKTESMNALTNGVYIITYSDGTKKKVLR